MSDSSKKSRRELKLDVMRKVLLSIAELSTCKRRAVAAIVFPRDFSEISAIGFNGPAASLPNTHCRDLSGACGCAHAEANALIKLRATCDKRQIMMCTLSPCEQCLNLIINSKCITEIIYLEQWKHTEHLNYSPIPLVHLK